MQKTSKTQVSPAFFFRSGHRSVENGFQGKLKLSRRRLIRGREEHADAFKERSPHAMLWEDDFCRNHKIDLRPAAEVAGDG